jgi:hypothetical protein
MRKLLLFLTLSLTSQYASANKVDDLKTDKDVAVFITSLDTRFHQKNSQFVVMPTDDIIKSLECDFNIKAFGIKNWEKVDFNNDGLTDLLVIGYWHEYTSYVAIDKGNNKFKLISIYYSPFSGCEITRVSKINGSPVLLFHTNKGEVNPNEKRLYMLKEIPITDTLIYKFDAFVELNKDPSEYKIASIKFETTRCFGTCPVFSIEINKSGNATYNAGIYSQQEGVFKTYINSNALKEIYDLINYTSIKKLKDDYEVNWTDSPTCFLTVKFSDGTEKKIKDYGELGTFGLQKLYAIFFDLRNSQYWQQD